MCQSTASPSCCGGGSTTWAATTGCGIILDLIVSVAGLDADLARAWSIVRSVDYWLWGLEAGLTIDPVRCARVLGALGPGS